jgi:hypothetical protein
MDERRVITSAIRDMSVAEVRKALATMRKIWDDTLTDENSRPMYIGDDTLIRMCSVQEFSYRFVLGHHEKRLSKARTSSLISASTDTSREKSTEEIMVA